MTNREVADIVKTAELLGMDGLQRARFILNSGVTLAEYRRFEIERTFRTAVICLIGLTAVWLWSAWVG